MRFIHGSSSIGVKALPLAEADFSLSLAARERLVTPALTGQVTVDDVVYDRHTSATVDREHDVLVGGETEGIFDYGIGYESSDEGVATVDEQGRVTRVSDGSATIIVRAGRRLKGIVAEVVRQSGVTTDQFAEFASGSLARACADAVDGAISTGEMPMYSSGNSRNASCWAATLADLSCIDRNKPNAHLIGQQFALQAAHYVDSSDTYVAMDGTVQTATVLDRRRIGTTDISVVKYAQALPTKFIPALLPPATLADHFSAISVGIPTLSTDQDKNALVDELYQLSTLARMKAPTDATRASLYQDKISGDSGSPAFLLIPGDWDGYSHKLMSLTAWTYGGPGSGPNYANYLVEIIAAVVEMGGNEGDVTVADLSSFPTYGV